MQYIDKLHNRYLNEPVWVVGSDPTLDEYPDNFLDNKVGVTLHMAALKFPKSTYRFFNEFDRLDYLKDKIPGIMQSQMICTMPFFGRDKETTLKLTGEGENVYYLDDFPYPPRGIPLDVYSEVGYNHMKTLVRVAKDKLGVQFGSNGTCLHNALYAVIMMGANPINIIACGHKAINGKDHFSKVNDIDKVMRPNIGSFSDPTRGNRMVKGTEAIMEGCKDLGIKVNWHKHYE